MKDQGQGHQRSIEDQDHQGAKSDQGQSHQENMKEKRVLKKRMTERKVYQNMPEIGTVASTLQDLQDQDEDTNIPEVHPLIVTNSFAV